MRFCVASLEKRRMQNVNLPFAFCGSVIKLFFFNCSESYLKLNCKRPALNSWLVPTSDNAGEPAKSGGELGMKKRRETPSVFGPPAFLLVSAEREPDADLTVNSSYITTESRQTRNVAGRIRSPMFSGVKSFSNQSYIKLVIRRVVTFVQACLVHCLIKRFSCLLDSQTGHDQAFSVQSSTVS